MIPYGHQSVDADDVAAVVAVLQGDWLTQGPAVAEFETRFAERVGARHAVAFANGTAALHGACAAAGLGPGDTVATSTLSFVASANCARYVGAGVRLLDVDPETLNLDPASVPEVDALVAVHYAGLPVDLTRLVHRPRVVIEDAAHAVGAATPAGPVGNCAHSDLCCFSFHPVKTMTTGEGGMVTTNDADLAERLRRFRHHGITPRPEDGAWAYDVGELAYNYRLTDLQAALGTSQLRKLDAFLDRRAELAQRYRVELAGADVLLPPAAPPGVRHGLHLFPIRVARRRAVFDALRAAGVGVQVHYVPIHHHSLYREGAPSLPNADAAYAGLLSLPLYPALTEAEQDVVVAAGRTAVRAAA
ncbi:MAG: aminotransferase class I/II-fold pyridoxal phosphate-dependent enzyme [Acidimicrobiia bacterium]